MADRTLTVNGQPFTFNRDRFAGVRTMTLAVDELPLTDATTSIKVTVAGHSDLDGVYTGTGADNQWIQQGGNGRIATSGYNSENGDQRWFIYDTNDFDPNGESNGLFAWSPTHVSQFPWLDLPSSHAVKITGVAGTETITVDRTAPVITSDRKGESRPLLSKLVGGAAAAYSLRDLNDKAGNNKVVRVRRASDNAERDFLAKEVSNGTLKNWVNTQTVLPLDIQALTADGRTGSVIPAKAAYSLRSLGTRQATVAATGDTVARADGKYVVQVRRSFDDAVKSFTADEVTDGTLLAFTNEDYAKYTSDFSAGDNSWGDSLDDLTAAGNIDGIGGLDDNLRLTIGSATSQHRAFRSSILPIGQKINFSIRVFIPSTNSVVDSFRILDASGTQIIASTTPAQDQWVTVTASNVTPTNNSGQLRLFLQDGGTSTFAGNGSDVIYIREVVVTQVTSDGLVKTWYDQSVDAGGGAHGNHAVQATAGSQPKIVNAGALVTDSGIGGLDFDGDDFLVAPSVSGLESPFSMFSSSVRDTTGYTASISKSTASNRYFGIQEASTTSIAAPRNATSGVSVSASASEADRLTFAVTTGETSTSVGAKGGTLANTTDDYGSDFTSGSGLDQISIGVLRTVSPSGYFDGRIREIIFYTSDQTDNRTAIEANIGEAYSITGIPAYDNTVDGFVETWYDQSGNSNDAVQAVSTEQPKIVNAGSVMLNDDGHPAIGFQRLSGGSTYFDLTTGIDIANSHSFQYVEFQKTYTYTLVESAGGGSNRIGYLTGSQLRLYRGGSLNFSAGTSLTNNPFIYTTFLAADGSASKVNVNGDEVLNQVLGNGTGGTTFNAIFRGDNSGLDSQFTKLSELIVYDTDQSANRPAIEANINNQYDIY